MKKIIILSLFLFSLVQIQAQDAAYKAEVKKMLNANNVSFEETFVQLFELAKDGLPYKTVEERVAAAKSYAKKYQDTQAYDDVSDVYMPYYKKYLTLDEVKNINKTLQDEKYKTAYDKTNSNEFSTKLGTMCSFFMVSIVATIEAGEEPKPVLDVNEKGNSYYKKYQILINENGTKNLITNILNAISSNTLSKATDEEQKNVINKAFTFYNDQALDMCYTIYKEILSEEELDLLIELFSKHEFKKLAKVSGEISTDIMNMGAKSMSKISNWLSTQNFGE